LTKTKASGAEVMKEDVPLSLQTNSLKQENQESTEHLLITM